MVQQQCATSQWSLVKCQARLMIVLQHWPKSLRGSATSTIEQEESSCVFLRNHLKGFYRISRAGLDIRIRVRVSTGQKVQREMRWLGDLAKEYQSIILALVPTGHVPDHFIKLNQSSIMNYFMKMDPNITRDYVGTNEWQELLAVLT